MHLSHTAQRSIQNRSVHFSVLNVALWNMEQVHSGICEICLLGFGAGDGVTDKPVDDDVMEWTAFRHYRSLVRGIQRRFYSTKGK